MIRRLSGAVAMFAAVAVIFYFLAFCGLRLSYAMEGDDHGNHGHLKAWFDQLSSKKGLCCSFADGVTVQDVDYDSDGDSTKNSGYRVRVTKDWPTYFKEFAGQMVEVPKNAMVEEPNRFGAAVVWPYLENGTVAIRCFIPGAGI